MVSVRSDYSVSLSTQNLSELEWLLEKQLNIKEALGGKLPDKGSKIEKYIDKIKSVINDRKKTAGTESHLILDDRPIAKDHHHSRKSDVNVDINDDQLITSLGNEAHITKSNKQVKISSKKNQDEEISAISLNLANLYLRSKNELGESDDFTTIPELDVSEFSTLWHSLNLPSLQPKSYRWFVFTLRVVDDLVYLTVLDCASPNRYLVRVGSRKIWFPDSKAPTSTNPTLSSESNPRRLDQSSQTLHDFWQFICPKPESDSITPCLLCYPTNEATVDDLTWFSRLLRSTRHSRLARCSLVPNCRFANARRALSTKLGMNKLEELRLNALKSEGQDMLQVEQLSDECRWVSQLLFPDTEVLDQVQYFSTISEFLQEGLVRSLTWMEAPMELRLLRQLKQNSVRMNKFTNKPNLSTISDSTLGILACLGLGRTRLTRLAGLGRWSGFSGFMSFGSFDSLSAELRVHKQKHSVLVTSDKQTLLDLYQYFSLIYKHMIRHERCFEDHNYSYFNLVKPKSESRMASSDGTVSSLVGQDRIQAWTSSGNYLCDPMGRLQLKLINFDQSTKLIRQAHELLQNDDFNRSFMKAPSNNISHYRDPTLSVHSFLDEDDGDDLSDGSMDSDSADSLKLEDVD